jgi:hypothetical protein
MLVSMFMCSSITRVYVTVKELTEKFVLVKESE